MTKRDEAQAKRADKFITDCAKGLNKIHEQFEAATKRVEFRYADIQISFWSTIPEGMKSLIVERASELRTNSIEDADA
jgi:hypothetical protein